MCSCLCLNLLLLRKPCWHVMTSLSLFIVLSFLILHNPETQKWLACLWHYMKYWKYGCSSNKKLQRARCGSLHPNPCSVNTEAGELPWLWSHPGLHSVFWTSLGYRVRTCLQKNKQEKNWREMVVEFAARPASIPSLIILFLIQFRSSCTWKNEVLPPSKLSLLNTCEDQQKNSSSFANVSWCPVKSGHNFHAWSVPLWFVYNRSLFLATVCDEWALPPDQNSVMPVVFDSIVITKPIGNCPKIV